MMGDGHGGLALLDDDLPMARWQATRRNAGKAPQRAKYVALPMAEGGRVVPVDKWEADHVRNYSTSDWKAKVQVWRDSLFTLSAWRSCPPP